MPPDDKQSKTEQASSYKLRKAREKGQVARSADLSSTLALTAGVIMISIMLPNISKGFDLVSLVGFKEIMLIIFKYFASWVSPIILVIWLVAFIATTAQVGFSVSFSPLSLDIAKLNPIAGFQRLLSVRGFVNVSFALIKMTIVSMVAFSAFSDVSNTLALLHLNNITLVMNKSAALAWDLLMKICMTMLTIAVIDYAYQKWQFLEDQKMSKEEQKEEHKQQEGNPQIKSRIKSMQRSQSQKRGLKESVQDADVVITNPFHLAVAIKYDRSQKQAAPIVVAKGARLLALRIREFAKESGIEIVQNIPLARALYKQCNVGLEITPDLYVAVAEVLAIVFRKRKKGYVR
jgi:flagellar biosynthesis protein FlhB